MKKQFQFPGLLLGAAVLIVLVIAFLPIGTVDAQQSSPSDDEVNAIARQLYCPVCENTPLDVCPTQACHQWRELIRQMLAEGKTEEQIKQYFVDNYGARVLPTPPLKGINWLVYIVPPVAFLAGVYLLFRAFRAWRQMAKEPAADSFTAGEDTPSDTAGDSSAENAYVARLEEELRKRK